MAGAVAAQTAPAPRKSAFDKAAFEAYIRHLLLYPKEVKVTVGDPRPSEVPNLLEVSTRAEAGQASEERTFLVSKDGSKIIRGEVFDINENPFKKDLDRLKTELNPSMGTPGAPVVIALFSDFQCQYCKQEGEALRRDLLKTFPTQVRVYFKDFPLTQIHPWAMPAAVAGRCVFRQKPAAFWDFHDWAFARQSELTEQNFDARFDEFARTKGLDTAVLKACREGGTARREVERSMAEGRALGVTSTPTLFINGRKIGGYLPFENLKQIVEFEANYQSTARNAGEACCTLQGPGLLNPPANPVIPKR